MNKFIVGFFMVFFCCTALYSAPENWFSDYDAAVKLAAKEKKHLLVLFTGSDWCPGCIALNKETLSKPEFIEFAKKNLVLVYMDSPRYKAQSAAEKEAVVKLYRRLEPGPYIPATVIVASDGRILTRIAGFLPLNEYIKRIEAVLK